MKPLISIVVAAPLAWATLGAATAADAPAAAPAASPQASAPATESANAEWADAEVRKVDRDTRKLTLKHGEIKNLDMPPMTMLFQVGDPALLDRVKPGDKVRFQANKVGGILTVTALQPAP